MQDEMLRRGLGKLSAKEQAQFSDGLLSVWQAGLIEMATPDKQQ